jgi:hypothetical protein
MPRSSHHRLVTGISSAQCQGLAFLLTTLSTSVSSQRVSMESAVALPEEAIDTKSERLPWMSLRPPLPPPKIVG